MYDLLLFLTFLALLFSPYLLNTWCDMVENRRPNRHFASPSIHIVERTR